jgi:hypothetical protein
LPNNPQARHHNLAVPKKTFPKSNRAWREPKTDFKIEMPTSEIPELSLVIPCQNMPDNLAALSR